MIYGSEDPEMGCILTIHFSSGYPMQVRTMVRTAREAIKAWNKYVVYSVTDEAGREGMDRPFYSYHFLCSNKEGDMCASIIFPHVVGMVYYVPEKEKDKGKG